jgi:thiol-disulfide isomerase/thioredoxin
VKGLARVLLVLGVGALVLFVAARLILPRLFTTAEEPEPPSHLVGQPLPDLGQVAGWLSGDDASADSLRGHAIVVALWSDTDPECLRALPALEAWHQAYRRYGVRVVGVHEPDFAFAADASVPRRVAERLRLSFPIALDPSYVLRRVLGGPAEGPRLVLADPGGTIVAAGWGRARMPEIERALRDLLQRLRPDVHFPPDPGRAAPAPAGTNEPRTRVVPLGVARVREGPLAGAMPGEARAFTAQFRYQVEGRPYVPYPVGLWTPGGDGATAARGGAENYIALRYDGGALWAVMSPPAGETVRVWVLSDERWLAPDMLGADARRDGRGASYLEVSEPRLYAVCGERAGEHVVKLSPGEPGLTVHALIVEPAEAAAPRDH